MAHAEVISQYVSARGEAIPLGQACAIGGEKKAVSFKQKVKYGLSKIKTAEISRIDQLFPVHAKVGGGILEGLLNRFEALEPDTDVH